MQLGRLFNSKDKPLGLKWIKCSTRFLGIYLSYDQKGNDYLKFTNCKQTLKYLCGAGLDLVRNPN